MKQTKHQELNSGQLNYYLKLQFIFKSKIQYMHVFFNRTIKLLRFTSHALGFSTLAPK